MAPPSRIEWREFVGYVDPQTGFHAPYLQWRQGEHIAIIAPTGRGKTTLMRALLWERDWVVVLCSKKKDSTYATFMEEGYTRSPSWPPPPPPKGQESQHVLLWPKVKTIDDLYGTAPLFRKTLGDVFVDENWCVGLDDLNFLCDELKLLGPIKAINYQVRSAGISLVSCMQRPVSVPKGAWNQCSHAFVRSLTDIDDLRTIRGLSTVTAKELEGFTRLLRPYEWLYLPVASGDHQAPVIVKPPA